MKKGDWKGMQGNAGTSAVYGLGFIGALIYYLQQASSLQEGILGFLKAIIWPVLLIYKLLEFLGM